MTTNESVIHTLYAAAEAEAKDTDKFISLFSEDGYFLDVSPAKKYYGHDVGEPVDAFDSAFPDMHRELFDLNVNGDVVVVELALRGTHRGDLHIAGGTIRPTGKKIDVPCCDVFHLKDGKVTSFHCYTAASVLLQQLGVAGNLEAALQH